MLLKAFFVIYKMLSLKQIKQFFLEGESPTLKRKKIMENVYN